MVRAWMAAVAAAIALGGCAREDKPQLPAACRQGAPAVESALRSAPADVRLEGDVKLSDCLVRASDQGDVLLVGEVYLEAAARLADRSAALQLGYLVGAVHRGASDTQGIHDELLRRIEQEAARVDRADPAFRRGEQAGRESG